VRAYRFVYSIGVMTLLSTGVLTNSASALPVYEPHSCMSGRACLNHDQPVAGGCATAGFDWTSSLDNSTANLTLYNWGSPCAGGDLNDDADNMKNRQSGSMRTLCVYVDINAAGASQSKAYTTSESWVLLNSSLRNEASSMAPRPPAGLC
jgi:hypothetical protein